MPPSVPVISYWTQNNRVQKKTQKHKHVRAKPAKRGRAPTGDPAQRVERVKAAEHDEGRSAEGQQQHGPGHGGGHSPAQNLRGHSVRDRDPAAQSRVGQWDGSGERDPPAQRLRGAQGEGTELTAPQPEGRQSEGTGDRHHPPAQRLRGDSGTEPGVGGDVQPEDRPAGAAPAARPPPPPWPRPGRPFKAAAQRPRVSAPRHFRRAPRRQPMAGRARPLPGRARVTSLAAETTTPGVPRAVMEAWGAWGLLRVRGQNAARGGEERKCHISAHYVRLFSLWKLRWRHGPISSGSSPVTTPCLGPNPPHRA